MVERVFDCEFGPVGLVVSRGAGTPGTPPTSVTWTNNTRDGELLYEDTTGKAIFYQQIDLSELSVEGRTFKPIGVNVQRPWNAPEGQDSNFMVSTRPVELIYIFSNALPNEHIRNGGVDINAFRDLGLDASDAYQTGDLAVIPDGSNTIWAQETKYFNSIANSMNNWNGFLVPNNPTPPPIVTGDYFYPLLCADMSVAETNTWGEMRTILGPVLHCYRVICHETQNLTSLAAGNPIFDAAGHTDRKFSPISVKILCKEEKLTEGEYLVEAANAYNNSNWDAESEV